MASETRKTSTGVASLGDLTAHPEYFELLTALRRVEQAFTDSPRLGKGRRIGDDPIRVRQMPTLAFARSALVRFDPNGGPHGHGVLEQTALGFLGCNGPLPLHFTETALARWNRDDDPVLLRFLDIFHHRYVTLLYRAWAGARPTVSRDRTDDDRFAAQVAALSGAPEPSSGKHPDQEFSAQIHFVGRFGSTPRTAESLESMIESTLGVPASVAQYFARWIRLPTEEQTRLGAAGEQNRLGRLAGLGACGWQGQQSFRIRLGPLGLRRFRDFLPAGSDLADLEAIVSAYVKSEFDWDVQILIAGDEVPAPSLGQGGQLGWTLWLGGCDASRVADDVVVRPKSGLRSRSMSM